MQSLQARMQALTAYGTKHALGCTETSSNVDPAVSDRAGNHMGSWWYMRERGMHPQAT